MAKFEESWNHWFRCLSVVYQILLRSNSIRLLVLQNCHVGLLLFHNKCSHIRRHIPMNAHLHARKQSEQRSFTLLCMQIIKRRLLCHLYHWPCFILYAAYGFIQNECACVSILMVTLVLTTSTINRVRMIKEHRAWTLEILCIRSSLTLIRAQIEEEQEVKNTWWRFFHPIHSLPFLFLTLRDNMQNARIESWWAKNEPANGSHPLPGNGRYIEFKCAHANWTIRFLCTRNGLMVCMESKRKYCDAWNLIGNYQVNGHYFSTAIPWKCHFLGFHHFGDICLHD